MTDKKVLLLFAHPAQEQSDVNIHLFQAAQQIDGVTCVDLYAEYPDHDIDVDIEQQRLCEHDVIIFQFPLYWYSTPAILKDWMDLVLQHGFAYGKDGRALEGKVLLTAITAGGPEKAYQEGGFNHFSIRELLRPLEQTARFCHMTFAAPFMLFAARTAVDEDRFKCHERDWIQLLEALINDQLDIESTKDLPKINAQIPSTCSETKL